MKVRRFLEDWIAWARLVWPNAAQRRRVAEEYSTFRGLQLLQADLALRNHVFGPAPDADNLFTAGIAEGRRRAVIELFLLTRINPQVVIELHRPRSEGDRT